MTSVFGFPFNAARVVMPGGPAGAHKLPGGFMRPDATLLDVRHLSADLQTNADLTSEFEVWPDADNTIINPGGTDTTDDFLLVVWAQPHS
jgi:hypothetical protein